MSSTAQSPELIQQLLARVQRLEDMIEMQKLQSKYAHLLFKLDTDRIMDECIAKRANDVTLEFSDSGLNKGLEKIRQVYKDFGGARQVPGFFIMHMTVNPYIEIAADGMSAKRELVEAPDHGTVTEVLTDKPDEPPTLYKPYSELKKQTNIFQTHPELPQPY